MNKTLRRAFSAAILAAICLLCLTLEHGGRTAAGERVPAGGNSEGGGGSMDSGGGGFLHYRASLALEIVQRMLTLVKPEDLPAETSAEIRSLYTQQRSFLLHDAKRTRIHLRPAREVTWSWVDRGTYQDSGEYHEMNSSFLSNASPGAEISIAEGFWDGTLGIQGTHFMSSLVETVFYFVVGHAPIGQKPGYWTAGLQPHAISMKAWNLVAAIRDAAIKKGFSHDPEYNQLFSYGFVAFDFSEFLKQKSALSPEMMAAKIEKAKTTKTSAFRDRVSRARRLAMRILDTAMRAAPAGVADLPEDLQTFLQQHLATLRNGLASEKISERLEQTGFHNFYGKQAKFQEHDKERITLTEGARYAHLDELAFLLIHEVGHSLPAEDSSAQFTDYEHTLNTLAYHLVRRAVAVDQRIRKIIENDRRKNPVDLFEIFATPDKKVLLTEPRVDGKYILYREPMTSEEFNRKDNGYEERKNHSKRICEYLGFKGLFHWQESLETDKPFAAVELAEDGTWRSRNLNASPKKKATIYDSIYCKTEDE